MPFSRADAEVEVVPVAAVYDRRNVVARRAGGHGDVLLCSSVVASAVNSGLNALRTAHATRQKSAVIDRRYSYSAFTLIELLVVIAIIAVLAGLAFPVFQSIQNSAKKTQAKNDVTQIVTAVNAFYTEYGKYPLPASATSDAAATYGSSNSNKALFDELRGVINTLNTRQIVFLSPPEAKDPANPRSGIAGTSSPKAGEYFDPWGSSYFVSIDWNYDNEVLNPYGADKGAGPANIRQGVLSWSLGKDQALGKAGNNIYTGSDDVISWQ
jgi:prepilin-type N-terminal cleavage/methylation domain-containing protein